jgi:hypothetical protein
MAMFGFFKSSAPKIKVIDRIWMSQAAKWKACQDMLKLNRNCLFVAWFEQTFNELRSSLPQGNRQDVILAVDIDNADAKGRMTIFVEHYPLISTEQNLFERLNLPEVLVLSSLDEPLFGLFGGEKMVELLRRLGMNDDEVLGHSMINKSIRNGQKKIQEKVVVEKKAASQRDWIGLNLKA